MKIELVSNNEHGSEEWHSSRIGKITASKAFNIIGKGKDKEKIFSDTATMYLLDVVGEMMTGMAADKFSGNKSTDWGNEWENVALDFFEKKINRPIKRQVQIIDSIFTATIDGIIDDKIGVEVKCPYRVANHLENKRILDSETLLKKRHEYYWQIIFAMIIADIDEYYFISFDPRFNDEAMKMHVLKINKIENLENIMIMKERMNEAKRFIENEIVFLLKSF